MLLLFLDTETTGVSFTTDHIIEIGGLLVRLDPITFNTTVISTFQTTTKLRQKLEEKISRITGITEEELLTSPNLITAQNLWADWLEPYGGDVLAIVGHSIDFDLNFIQKESWFLPPNYQLIDTLDLTKILLPQVSAVNLEFLAQKLDLVLAAHALDPEDTKTRHHRSLYDCAIGFALFERLLTVLQNQRFGEEFNRFLIKNFLPIPLELSIGMKSEKSINPPSNTTAKTVRFINWHGQLKPLSLGQKIQAFNSPQALEIAQKLLDYNLEKDLALVTAQIYVLIHLRLQHPDWTLKLHLAPSQKSVWFAELLLDFILEQLPRTEANFPFQLEFLEDLVWVIRSLNEEVFELGKYIDYVDYTLQVTESKGYSFPTQELKELMTSYDFFLWTLQPFLQTNEYYCNPQNLGYQERVLFQKLKSFQEKYQSANIIWQNLEIQDSLLNLIRSRMLQIMKRFQINGQLIFQLSKNALIIRVPKQQFSLQNHLESLNRLYPELKISTQFVLEDVEKFLKISGIKLPKSWELITGINHEYLYVDSRSLTEFIIEKQDLAVKEQKPILFLAGLNSTLKDLERIVPRELSNQPYLILGESGSLTKVISKAKSDFSGLVVLKFNNIDYILSLPNELQFHQIWVVNWPYFPIHDFWYKKANVSGDKELFLDTLRKLHLRAKINGIFSKSQTQVGFLRAYTH